MKGMNLFCSSISSTAVTDHHSKVRKTTKRHASIPRKSQLCVPCSSRLLPINPKPQNGEVRRKGSNIQVNNLYGTSSSTRYLLSDWVSESNKIPSHSHKPTLQNQVVVLRVSLHCKACARKVTKHISKMEGVTSFSIDTEAKKVTIIGHVTPLGVLASVSKVKNAQLWPSSTSSSLSSSMPSGSEVLHKFMENTCLTCVTELKDEVYKAFNKDKAEFSRFGISVKPCKKKIEDIVTLKVNCFNHHKP